MTPTVSSPAQIRVLALISLGTMINYLDRTVLGIAAPGLSRDLHLSPVEMGLLFSVFSWSYAAAQLPSGWLLDRIGSRITYFLAITFWSLFTLLQGLAPGLPSMIALRLGLGVSEAPCFPANSRVVTLWFRPQQRAQATAVYTVGEYLGLVCFGPLLYWLAATLGWRSLFVVVGTAGIGFAGIWWWLYREPTGVASDGHSPSIAWRQIRQLLRHRQLWGAAIGQFGGNSTLVFFLTWFPSYLARERHMDWIRTGWFGVLPFVAAACGVLAGGWGSDALLRRTGSPNLARKLPVVGGLFGASTIILANTAVTDAWLIAIFSFAFFCQGMTGLGWAVLSDIAPRQLMGTSGGLFNFAANIAGILTPLVIGWILSSTGSFTWALAYVAAAAAIGACSYVFLLGDVERIRLD